MVQACREEISTQYGIEVGGGVSGMQRPWNSTGEVAGGYKISEKSIVR